MPVHPRDPANWHFAPLILSGAAAAVIEGIPVLSVTSSLETLASLAFLAGGFVFFS
jgi:hypothetical protein